jgi:hypothetical protein
MPTGEIILDQTENPNASTGGPNFPKRQKALFAVKCFFDLTGTSTPLVAATPTSGQATSTSAVFSNAAGLIRLRPSSLFEYSLIFLLDFAPK